MTETIARTIARGTFLRPSPEASPGIARAVVANWSDPINGADIPIARVIARPSPGAAAPTIARVRPSLEGATAGDDPSAGAEKQQLQLHDKCKSGLPAEGVRFIGGGPHD